MATATRTRTRAKAKPAPEPEPVEEDEVELEDDLEELEEDEVDETPARASKKSASSKKAQTVTFGVADLAAHLSVEGEKPVTTRELRTLIRKMARDGQGRVNREVVAGNRSRYDWSGVDDPEVKAIIAAFHGGELAADKAEKLAALKERKAAQKATAEKPAAPAAKGTRVGKAKPKAAPVVEVEDDDEELDLDDED